MIYKCIQKDKYETWLTVGEEYEGEVVVQPAHLSGGFYIRIYKADDGHPCYVKKSQFENVYRNPFQQQTAS